MDLQQIEQLIDKYFEGETSVSEEKILHQYFKSMEVAPHLEVYRGMFNYFSESKKETLELEPEVERTVSNGFIDKMKSWYGIAALFIVALGVGLFFNQDSAMTAAEKQEAQAAYEATKEALDFVSKQFNESTQQMAYLHEFGERANEIFK